MSRTSCHTFCTRSLGPERFKTRPVGWSEAPCWRETTCIARQNVEDDAIKLEVGCWDVGASGAVIVLW